MKTMKTDTGNETWMGLVKNNVTRAAMLLVMMLICLTAGAQEEIEYYDLWLGSTQVTSANKDNILNQVDADGNPTAKYDHTRGICTLTLNNPVITGSHNNCKIYLKKISNGGVFVKGSYHMPENENLDYGIYTTDMIVYRGDFTFYGSKSGIYSDSTISIDSGSLKAIGGDYGIFFEYFNDITEFDVYNIKTLVIQGNTQAFWGNNVEVDIKGDYTLTTPEGGSIVNNQFYEADGTTVAKHVIIQKESPYSLWLGWTAVTPENKDNILNQVDADGNPTAKYDPEHRTLTLNNPTITGVHVFGEDNATAVIYSAASDVIKIDGTYHQSTATAQYGIYWNSLYFLFMGDFTFRGTIYGLYAKKRCDLWTRDIDMKVSLYGGTAAMYCPDLRCKGDKLHSKVVAYPCNTFSKYDKYPPRGSKLHHASPYICDEDGNIAKDVEFQEWEDLWIGSTEVLPDNCNDILGDGKASYDPTTKTLTLNNPTIPGTHDTFKYNNVLRPADKIYAGDINLTIKGSYHQTETESLYSLFILGSLTLDGDFTFLGDYNSLDIRHNLTIKSGSLKATSMDEEFLTGYGCIVPSLTIEDEVAFVDLQGGNAALVVTDENGLHLAEGMVVTSPKGGTIQKGNVFDGEYIAQHVLIQNATNPIQFYDLWVGSTHVSNNNQNDIFGDGKASFDPETNTLTLQNNPTIPGTTKGCKIYSKLPSLTITGCYHMTEAETINGIYSEGGSLVLDGDFTILSKGHWITFVDGHTSLSTGNTLWAEGDITLNGNITVRGQDVAFAAIYTEKGVILVQGGNLQASANNNSAIECDMFLYWDDTESITLEGTPGAIYTSNMKKLVPVGTPGRQLKCYEPENAYYSETYKSVYHIEDNIARLATRVVLRKPKVYNLWVGSTQVTEDNCDDILNQKDSNGNPTAKYNPETNTLTLNNPTISGTKNDCAIYAEHMDLTVKGSATVSTTASCAIKLFIGELTLDGNFTFEGNDYAIWFNPIMKLGQTIEITSPDDAVFMGENTVKYGNDVAKSVTIENVIRYKIWLGSTQVTGDNHNDILGNGTASFDPDTETLTLNNPTISGTKNGCAIYAEWMDLTVKGRANINITASCAIKLMYGELTFDGDFNLTGNDYAIWFNRTMKLGQTTEITSPENVDFMGGNTVVLKSDYSTVANSVTMRKVENKYKIWLGNTQVTSINKDDIFNDGKASYNPETQTLTLNDPTISGTYSVGKIFIMDYDLTIRGSYHMNSAEESVGLYVSNCTLKLIGDFTFRGSLWGVESDRDITVKGSLNAIGTSTGIHFDNENCHLALEHGFMTSRVEMSGDQYAMSGGSVATGATLLTPEGGSVNNYGFIRTANNEIAKDAVLEYRGASHGDGTEANPYLIKSKEDWNLLAEDIEAGASTRGIYFALIADIKVRKMMGTEQNPFSGTFNGYGCTLTADINEDMQGVALFHAISGATIRNLKVAGTVIGSTKNAGLVGYVKGNDNLIQNCEVTASIGASKGGYNGGILGHAGSYTTRLEDCVFCGEFFSTYAFSILNNGTFVGWDEKGAQLTLTRCLDLTQNDPIGRGLTEPTTTTNVYSTYDKSSITENLAWTTQPKLAYKVTGADVDLTLTGTTGATWNGNLYAAQGETLSFTVNRPYVAFTSTAGTFTQDQAGNCTLVMPGENVTILDQNASSFDIAKADVTNGTVSVKNASRAGAVVGIHITPDTYYLLDEVTVKDADNNEYEVEIEGEYGFFTMPNSNVTVTVTFKKQYSFENGVLHLKYGDFNIIDKLAFDTDVMEHRGEVLKVIADEGVSFTQSCATMFKDFVNCTEMDLSKVNTSALVTTSEMFSGCTNLQKLNLTGWETRQIFSMNSMFEGCSSLREIDLSGFHVSEGTSTTRLFGTTGICKLTLPAGMAVTKEMELNKGKTYKNTNEGTWSNGTWSYSGWTILGADGEVVSTVEADDNNSNFAYAVIPAPPVAMTFVWKDMPDDFILELPDGQDNSKTIADWNGITTSVQLTGRKLYKDGDWNTICLPFMLGPSEIISCFGTNTDFRGLDLDSRFNAQDQPFTGGEQDEDDFPYQTGFEEATGTLRLYFTPQNSLTHITPGDPFLIKWPNDTEHPYIESPTFAGVTIDISSDEANVSKTVTSNDGKVSFVGQYSTIVAEDDYRYIALGSGNTLGYVSKNSTLRPFRAHFEVPAGINVKAYQLKFGEDDETGIISMEDGRCKMEDVNDAWYDMSGRKLDGKPTKKGIYINNGKKIIIK